MQCPLSTVLCVRTTRVRLIFVGFVGKYGAAVGKKLVGDTVFAQDLGVYVVVEGKKIILLTIPAAKSVPTSYARERYIRIGPSKENLRKYPEKEAFLFEVLMNGFPTIENTPSDYQELTFEKMLIYYGAKGLKLNQETFKKPIVLYRGRKII